MIELKFPDLFFSISKTNTDIIQNNIENKLQFIHSIFFFLFKS